MREWGGQLPLGGGRVSVYCVYRESSGINNTNTYTMYVCVYSTSKCRREREYLKQGSRFLGSLSIDILRISGWATASGQVCCAYGGGMDNDDRFTQLVSESLTSTVYVVNTSKAAVPVKFTVPTWIAVSNNGFHMDTPVFVLAPYGASDVISHPSDPCPLSILNQGTTDESVGMVYFLVWGDCTSVL